MPNSWCEPIYTCPVCKGTGRAKGSTLIGCKHCLGRGTFDRADECYHQAVAAARLAASESKMLSDKLNQAGKKLDKAGEPEDVAVGQTWYVQLYERATLTKWWVTDLTDKTIELSKDQPAGHPPVVYRYRRDEIRLVERVS